VIGTPDELRELAGDLGASVPDSDELCARLLERAQGEVEVFGLGVRVTPELLEALTDEQTAALSEAVCRQALWQAELSDGDEWLGPPDNLSSIEGISFSRDVRSRISPTALEALALHGLIKRTGIARPEPEPVPPTDSSWPWGWW
jgi:hypothetical protein